MKSKTITEQDDLIIRRHILEPHEALPWHTGLCKRFAVVVTGEKLQIEFRDTGEIETIPVQPGLVDWDKPEPASIAASTLGPCPMRR
jgi:hypothetical protein